MGQRATARLVARCRVKQRVSRSSDGRVEEERCRGLRTTAVAAATRQRGEGREEELDLGLLGHEVQAGMDTGDTDEAKASGEEAPGGGAARSGTRASMASGPC